MCKVAAVVLNVNVQCTIRHISDTTVTDSTGRCLISAQIDSHIGAVSRRQASNGAQPRDLVHILCLEGEKFLPEQRITQIWHESRIVNGMELSEEKLVGEINGLLGVLMEPSAIDPQSARCARAYLRSLLRERVAQLGQLRCPALVHQQ